MAHARRWALLSGSWLALAAAPAVADPPEPAAPPAAPADEIRLVEGLILEGPVGTSARWPVHTDAVEARIVAGTWAPPKEGETLALPTGETRTWKPIRAGKKDAFDDVPAGSYLSFRVTSETERVMLLHAVGNDFVYVNGELRPGDVYSYGWLRLPVPLGEGPNELLFRVSRGRLSATLRPPLDAFYVSPDDATLPDLQGYEAGGRPEYALGSAVVVNAAYIPTQREIDTSNRLLQGQGRLQWIPPLSIRKLPFYVSTRSLESETSLGLSVTGQHEEHVRLRIPRARDPRRVTFWSSVDGSVQSYAALPSSPGAAFPPTGRALVLSLHGAGVEAGNQAASYASKPWATIVCPTNRRPYGFDWEDWGRADALEVLAHASELFPHDPARVYLTGHSMGGHGTWQIGVTFPDRFAAIAPSAGWASFSTYGGAPAGEPKDDVERMLRRAASPSDTIALLPNLVSTGVYVLHGDADDNVPVTEARRLVDALKALGLGCTVHEQPGAGHWWDASDEPGVDCVDWAPMFDFFARHSLPIDRPLRQVDFTTTDPAISASCRWVTVAAQTRSRLPSRVRLRCDPGLRRISGTTENVARLSIDLTKVPPVVLPITIELDGVRVADPPGLPPQEGTLWFERTPQGWTPSTPPPPSQKGPARAGPFKAAFDHGFLLVYGTLGAAEDKAWALAKARLDSETWYYRANGSVDVIPDSELASLRDAPDHNVILYGNADTNSAWDRLLRDSPVQVRHDSVKVGTREFEGDDLACLFVRPRVGSETTLIGVVAGTGLAGMRLCDRMPYFTSGIHFPDVTVMRADVLSKGNEGVLCAGFFGNDWSVETGEFAWREESKPR